jgi:DNA polymerase I
MNIPLYAKGIETSSGTKIEIWGDKSKRVFDRPFDPYMYFIEKPHIYDIGSEEVMVTKLSDLKQIKVYKYSFNTVKDVPRYRNKDAFECDIPYLQRVAIDTENYYLQYPQTRALDILYFDIETDTTGMFPRPERNKITAISYAYNDNDVQVLNINKLEEGDKYILEQFNMVLKSINPDVIVGYNCDYFDIPYIIERCRLQGITTKPWTRNGREAFYITQEGLLKINIEGRVVFDVYSEVLQDQTLYGITSRSLKDVAKWFNIQKVIRNIKGYEDYEIITEEVDNMRGLIGTERLRRYAESDVLITRALSNLYFKNILMFAEMLKVPISMVTTRTANLISTILYARNLKQQNIVGDSSNHQRYPQIFGKPVVGIHKGKIRTIFIEGTGYQGALVDIFKVGLFKDIYHIDFAGMYPSIIRTFNLSPETTKIIGYEDYGEFNFIKQQDSLIIKYPDKRINKNVVVRVDMMKQGFLPKMLSDYAEERAIIKKKLKNPETPKYLEESLVSRSWCLKVIANAAYGINGSAYFRYGDIAVSMTTTAMGRFFIQFVLNCCEPHNIEVDTDGVYVQGSVDIEQINKKLQDYVEKEFGFKCLLELEMDGPYLSGYFMKKKNYILLKDKDTLVFHGGAFKGSSKNSIFRLALKQLSNAMLKGESTDSLLRNIYNFDNNCLKDFVMRTKINKPLDMYKSKNCVQRQVAQQAQKELDIRVVIGDSIEYVKQINGYRIRLKASLDKIDKAYYKRQILKILDQLGMVEEKWKLLNPNQTKMEAWL